MQLPLVLAGPIVRRVEPHFASVWVALSAPAKVRLELYNKGAKAGDPHLFRGVDSPARRAGEQLYFAVATVDEADGALLLPGETYCYNLRFNDADDLQSLKLLEADREESEEDGEVTVKGHVALGYGPGLLPSFLTPPTDITELRLIHGSCRRPHVDTPDAMVWIDDFIEKSIHSADGSSNQRPHQLFLTGDQIYADDVAAPMLYMIAKHCDAGIAGVERMPMEGGQNLPINLDHFPVRMRKNFTISKAGFTSTDGENHLLSFAEFCLMYLFVWSNELWPARLPTLAEMLKPPPGFPHEIWKLHTGLGDDTGEGVKKEFEDTEDLGDMTPVNLQQLRDRLCRHMAGGYHKQREVMRTFRSGLPKVRRALANVATYMIFDDHEITDDWNLSPTWATRVNTSPTGGAIVRNGLLAYALCQGWGNDPKQFAAPSAHRELLTTIEDLFPDGGGEMNATAATEAEKLLGLTGASPPDVVTWHYQVPGPGYTVVSFDIRTRRGATDRFGAPENLPKEVLDEQLPAGPPGPGNEVLIILSSLTVLGPPVIDALMGPLLYKVYDLKSYIKHQDKRQLRGLNPDAIEAWPNHEEAFERLLERLSTYPRVVLLSGDVHYATSMAMTYFRKGAEPTRIAQFTSSAMKNLFHEGVRKGAQSFSFLQRVIAAKIDPERVIWDEKDPAPLNLPEESVPPSLLRRLDHAPVRLPTSGWPSGTQQNSAHPPDRAWRVHIPKDDRPDSQRPDGVRLEELIPGEPGADITFELDGYRKAAVKHAAGLRNINHDRQIVFASNLGLVTFQRRSDGLHAVQDLYAVHREPFAEAYTRHDISLAIDPAEAMPKVPSD